MIKDANCKNKTYRDRDLEKIILGEVFKLKTNPEYISQIHTSVDESEKAKMIEKQLGDIKKQISNLMDLYSLGTINMNDIKEKIEPLNEKRTALEGTLEKLKSNTFRKDKQEVFNMVDELKTAIDEKDSYTVNIMLNELIEKIIIDNEDIIIHWNF
jgi:site-specific DNA recombinase